MGHIGLAAARAWGSGARMDEVADGVVEKAKGNTKGRGVADAEVDTANVLGLGVAGKLVAGADVSKNAALEAMRLLW